MTDPLHRRATAFERRLLHGVATDVTDLPFGSLVLAADLADIHDQNLVVVDLDADPDPTTVADAVEELLAATGATHRRVKYESGPAAAAAEPVFVERGWEPFRLVTMAWEGTARAWPDAMAWLEDADVEEGVRRMVASQPWGGDPELQCRFVAYARRGLHAGAGRVLGLVEDGVPQATARVYGLDGPVRQIEEVTVDGNARGLGLGRALMQAALAAATAGDPELVFLVADGDDWPRHWYERMGFRPVGTQGGFHRNLARRDLA